MSTNVFSRTRQFDEDTIRYVNQFTVKPTWKRLVLYDELVRQLKFAGQWNLLDRLWILAQETQQASRVSLVNPSSAQLTEVNAPAWVADQGYTSNGTSSHLNTNFNPATEGVNFTQNSASIHIYSRSNIAEDRFDIGSVNGVSTIRTHIITRWSTNVMYGSLNTAGISTRPVTDSQGFFSTQRTAANITTYYRNGASLGTVADVSAAVESLNGFICARNTQAGPSGWSTKQLSIAAYGSGEINNASFYSIIQRYMTGINSQV